MSYQQWKLVPVTPTPEMVAAVYVGKIEAQSVQHQQRAREAMARDYQTMLAASPVPRALEQPPVVLGYSVKGNRYAIRLTKGELLELHEGYQGDSLIQLVDGEHVTRLQARVANLENALRAFVDWESGDDGVMSLVDDESLWGRAKAALNIEYRPEPSQGIPGTSYQALNAKANAGDL